MYYFYIVGKSSFISILFLTMAVGLHSCTPIFHKWYGIEALNEFDQEKHQKTSEELSMMYPGPLLSYVGRDSMFREYFFWIQLLALLLYSPYKYVF